MVEAGHNGNETDLNSELGWCSPPIKGSPETGAQVFVFFEQGYISEPVYFGVSQSGPGWFSEHPDQHVFHSKNVTISIDENVKDGRSTQKHDTNTKNQTIVAKANMDKKYENSNYIAIDGSAQDVPSRVDIFIKAKDMTAINLNIIGNVNMKVEGDWYTEHIGDRYDYHVGETFVNHIGNTHIEQTGSYSRKQTGERIEKQSGNHSVTHEGAYALIRNGRENVTINGPSNYVYNEGKDVRINEYYMLTVVGNTKLETTLSLDVIALQNMKFMSNGNLTLNSDNGLIYSTDDVSIISKTGNITIKTEGKFDLFEDGVLSVNGYDNIGTKGNVIIQSTYGNIGLECITDDRLKGFTDRYVSVPWNPDFAKKAYEKYGESFYNLAISGELLSKNLTVNGLTDVEKYLDKMNELMIYDGLPVFYPNMMMVQSPKVRIENASWVEHFDDTADDWVKLRYATVQPTWKIPGKLMGNINVNTWSGDIKLNADSELGAGGNISLNANNKVGTISKYAAGTITAKSNSKKRIYPDARALFMDSDFDTREAYVHNNGEESDGGFIFNDVADKMMKSKFNVSLKFKNSTTRKFGDPYVVADFALGNQDIATEVCNNMSLDENLEKYFGESWLSYGATKWNPLDGKNPRGVFNINAISDTDGNDIYDKISFGDNRMIFDEDDSSYTIYKLGGMYIESNNNVEKRFNENEYTYRFNNSVDHIENEIHSLQKVSNDDRIPSIDVLIKWMSKFNSSNLLDSDYKLSFKGGKLSYDGIRIPAYDNWTLSSSNPLFNKYYDCGYEYRNYVGGDIFINAHEVSNYGKYISTFDVKDIAKHLNDKPETIGNIKGKASTLNELTIDGLPINYSTYFDIGQTVEYSNGHLVAHLNSFTDKTSNSYYIKSAKDFAEWNSDEQKIEEHDSNILTNVDEHSNQGYEEEVTSDSKFTMTKLGSNISKDNTVIFRKGHTFNYNIKNEFEYSMTFGGVDAGDMLEPTMNATITNIDYQSIEPYWQELDIMALTDKIPDDKRTSNMIEKIKKYGGNKYERYTDVISLSTINIGDRYKSENNSIFTCINGSENNYSTLLNATKKNSEKTTGNNYSIDLVGNGYETIKETPSGNSLEFAENKFYINLGGCHKNVMKFENGMDILNTTLSSTIQNSMTFLNGSTMVSDGASKNNDVNRYPTIKDIENNIEFINGEGFFANNTNKNVFNVYNGGGNANLKGENRIRLINTGDEKTTNDVYIANSNNANGSIRFDDDGCSTMSLMKSGILVNTNGSLKVDACGTMETHSASLDVHSTSIINVKAETELSLHANIIKENSEVSHTIDTELLNLDGKTTNMYSTYTYVKAGTFMFDPIYTYVVADGWFSGFGDLFLLDPLPFSFIRHLSSIPNKAPAIVVPQVEKPTPPKIAGVLEESKNILHINNDAIATKYGSSYTNKKAQRDAETKALKKNKK